MAERVGFEPTVQLLTGQPLSKRSCSTTPAPLRRRGRGIVAYGRGGKIGPLRVSRGKRSIEKGVSRGARARGEGRLAPDVARSDRDQHAALPGGRHGRAGSVGPPRHADGAGAPRIPALDAHPALRSVGARLAQPRPLRALGRPRLGAPLRTPPSLRLRPPDRRAAPLPPARIEDARPPRARAHAGRRDHHRPARSGTLQRGRHGDRRAHARRSLQPIPASTSSTTARS